MVMKKYKFSSNKVYDIVKLNKNQVLIDKRLIVSLFISVESNTCDNCIIDPGSCRVRISVDDPYSRSMCIVVASLLDVLYDLNLFQDMSLKLTHISLFMSRYIMNKYEKN